MQRTSDARQALAQPARFNPSEQADGVKTTVTAAVQTAFDCVMFGALTMSRPLKATEETERAMGRVGRVLLAPSRWKLCMLTEGEGGGAGGGDFHEVMASMNSVPAAALRAAVCNSGLTTLGISRLFVSPWPS